jgi:hypothetical protein
LAKYKKDNAHTKSRQNRTVWKVKLKLPVSPCQVNVLIVGRRGDLKQPKSSSKVKLHSQDQRDRELHTTMTPPPFRQTMPKSWVLSPMMFHPYAQWFGWYAPPMQYESFYPRSAKHESNVFLSSARPRKDHFYPKSWLNAAKTQEQPNQTVRFGNPKVPIFLARVGHIGLKKAYRPKKKANSNEGSNLDAHNEKSMFSNDMKQQNSTDCNSGARTGGMS